MPVLPPVAPWWQPFAWAAVLGVVGGLVLTGADRLFRPERLTLLLLIMGSAAIAGALALGTYRRVLTWGDQRLQRQQAERRGGLLEEAIRAAGTAIELGDTPAAHARLGILYLLADRPSEAVRALKRADRETNPDPILYTTAGVALAAQGRHEKALKAFQTAQRRLPGQPEVSLDLCLLRLAMGDGRLALKALRTAGERAQEPRWRQLQAALEALQGRPGVAVALLREALAASSRLDAGTVNALGVALATRGELGPALGVFHHAIALDRQRAAAWCNRGLVRLLQGQRPQALRDLRQARTLSPESELVQGNLGIAFHRAGDYESSKEAFRLALQQPRGLYETHHNLSQAYLEQELYDEALLAAEQALRHRPDGGAARLNLGCALFALNRFDEAIQHFELAVELPETEVLGHHNLGLAYAVSGRLDPALMHLEEASRLEPEALEHRDAVAYAYHINGMLKDAYRTYQELLLGRRNASACYHLGLADYALERYETAAQWLEESLTLEPGLHQAFFPLGGAYAALDQHEKAAEYWRKGLEYEPESPELLSNLGLAEYRKRNTEVAMDLLRRAYFARPDEPLFCNNLALAYAQAGRFDRAADFFENTVDLMPGSVVARCNLGLAYYLSGRVEAALEEWQTASKVDPTYYLRRQRQDLRNTFDDIELRALHVDWQTRALPRRPISAGFVRRFATELPDLPWQVLVTKEMLDPDGIIASWRDSRYSVVVCEPAAQS